MTFQHLVSVSWLKEHLTHDDLKVIDATFFLPAHGKNASEEYQKQAIPKAGFFDLDAIKDPSSSLPHMLPSAEDFAQAMQSLGIQNTDRVVVYDQHGLFSAARLWWMLKLFGHHEAFVLNGGLPAWIASGGPVERPRQPAAITDVPTPYQCAADNRDTWTVDLSTLQSNPALYQDVLDARPADRFNGTVPEPRAGMRSGHIPGSTNVPFADLVRDGHLLPIQDLKAVLGPKITAQPITSCGSGVTAAIISLALLEIGAPMGRLYDGSWADWGRQDAGTPVATKQS